MAAKFKILFQAKYKRGAVKLPMSHWPTFKHIGTGVSVHDVEVQSEGKCTLDGKEYIFHDLRVYMRED